MPHVRKGANLGCDTVLRAFRASQEDKDSPVSFEDLPTLKWEVDRDGGLPLVFEGKLLSFAEHETDSTSGKSRGTTVRIFVSKAGNYITSVQQWEGDERVIHRQSAAWHSTASQALEWLFEDGKGRLGKTSKEAWLQACRTKPDMENLGFKYVD